MVSDPQIKRNLFTLNRKVCKLKEELEAARKEIEQKDKIIQSLAASVSCVVEKEGDASSHSSLLQFE